MGQSDARVIHAEMTDELESSWRAWHALPQAVLRESPDGTPVRTLLLRWRTETLQARVAVEEYLRSNLEHLPEADWRASGLRFRRLANDFPAAASRIELARMAWDLPLVAMHNPLLSAAAQGQLQEAIRTWLQLCVLEDKLQRLLVFEAAGAMSESVMVRELQTKRTWEPAEHPEWLGFEAEGRLQIRPAQYAVAQHLIDHPHAVVQLNMGEGKTRVILPMLALHHFSKQRQRRDAGEQQQGATLRMYFLSALIHEAYDFLHRHLCGSSAFNLRLFLLPFDRDVDLKEADARALCCTVEHCREIGGVLVMAPEHRLSLQLKRLELTVQQHAAPSHDEGTAGDAKEGLAERSAVRNQLAAMEALPVIDLFDESDELMRHKYQLVYALGTPMALPSGPTRWGAAHALLLMIHRNPLQIAGILAKQGVCKRRETPAVVTAGCRATVDEHGDPGGGSSFPRYKEAFPELRLLDGKHLPQAVDALSEAAIRELLARPPDRFWWLSRVSSAVTERIVPFVSDATCEDAGLRELLERDEYMEDLLALRGLLAHGVLWHCLMLRHRVEYGIDRGETKRKQLAVPFRASDTPSHRSEFGHPDCAIILTSLAYYFDGLSYLEMQTALKTLLALGDNSQRAIYNKWFALSEDRMRETDRIALNKVEKIDISNSCQQELMWQYYRCNVETINFWLSNCVLPIETMQYPQRLIANAWHLADNAAKRAGGFSGTNDNHRLLPLQ
eukprot:gene643-1076_t